jgi:hypothetical protein
VIVLACLCLCCWQLHSALLTFKARTVSSFLTNTGNDAMAVKADFQKRAQAEAQTLMAGAVATFADNTVRQEGMNPTPTRAFPQGLHSPPRLSLVTCQALDPQFRFKLVDKGQQLGVASPAAALAAFAKPPRYAGIVGELAQSATIAATTGTARDMHHERGRGRGLMIVCGVVWCGSCAVGVVGAGCHGRGVKAAKAHVGSGARGLGRQPQPHPLKERPRQARAHTRPKPGRYVRSSQQRARLTGGASGLQRAGCCRWRRCWWTGWCAVSSTPASTREDSTRPADGTR